MAEWCEFPWCRLEGGPVAAQRSRLERRLWLGDLSGFPWTHWFSSHITDNCWMLRILPSPGWQGGASAVCPHWRWLSDLWKAILWHLIDCDWRACTSCPCDVCIFNRLSGELSSCLLGFYFTACKLASLKYNYKLWPEHVSLLHNELNV